MPDFDMKSSDSEDIMDSDDEVCFACGDFRRKLI